MKIIVIGATGAVGKTAVQALAPRHDIVTAGRSNGDLTVDLENFASIQAMFETVGKVDAVVSAIGHGHFGPVGEMTPEQAISGINAKAIAQINLVLAGIAHVNDGGSFTLTSGVLNRDPIRGGAAAAAANGAIDGFVRGAAVDMPRGIRINVVSPEVLEASRAKYDGFFRGHNHVSDHAVGEAFSKSVEGCLTGQVFIVA
ncbi:short chain dehydrogenase [Octadecabacter sp. R77987]|uniref:short chain dehydrogenase n=1 Tax=Octadecabacter sp. R77987 TaxID=3093874 RepID=UPI0036720585